MDELTLTPLPHHEVTRATVAHALVDLGLADDLEQGEQLARTLLPDLPDEITVE